MYTSYNSNCVLLLHNVHTVETPTNNYLTNSNYRSLCVFSPVKPELTRRGCGIRSGFKNLAAFISPRFWAAVLSLLSFSLRSVQLVSTFSRLSQNLCVGFLVSSPIKPQWLDQSSRRVLLVPRGHSSHVNAQIFRNGSIPSPWSRLLHSSVAEVYWEFLGFWTEWTTMWTTTAKCFWIVLNL